MADPSPYDALLLLSFGGPEAPQEVMPFLQRVTRGRGVPPERLAEVAEHYHHFGGRSPINDQNRALIAAITDDFAEHGLSIPVYWGNRNSAPFLPDTLATMRADGVSRAAVLVTSAYASYSGCRQYREDLADAVAVVGSENAPRLDRLRHYFNHPGFVTANADAVLEALSRLGERARSARVIFVTHSIPIAMAASSGPSGGAYEAQHTAVAQAVIEIVAERTGRRPEWDLVYCSRSGPPQVPWLEPDVNDHLRGLGATAGAVVLAPIGFISDHMEVVFDLDTEALAASAEVDLPAVRAATAGTHPAFVAAIRDLLLERAAVERDDPTERAVVGALPADHDVCPAGCCPNLRGPRPALAGMD